MELKDIDREVLQALEDMRSVELPTDIEKAVEKIKCDIRHGKRIYWYYQEEKDFYDEEEENPRQGDYSGIIVAANGVETSSQDCELEIEDCMVVQDTYPAQKEYCQCAWVALNRLLESDIVEIYDEF